MKVLKECERIRDEIRCKKLQLENLRDLRMSTAANYSEEKVQTTSRGDKIERLTAEIIDLENEINDYIGQYLNVYEQVEKMINSIEEPKVKEMMMRRYVLCEPWSKISEKMDVTRQTLWNWHREILQKFNEKFDTV